MRQACVFASLTFISNNPHLPHRCTKRLPSSPSWLLSSLWCAKRAACWWLWLLWSVACPFSRSSSAAFEPRMPKEKQLTVLVTVHSLHAADLPFSSRLSLLHFLGRPLHHFSVTSHMIPLAIVTRLQNKCSLSTIESVLQTCHGSPITCRPGRLASNVDNKR